jgi:predicted transposase YdaD
MKTDTIFYQLFQLLPSLLGELLGEGSTDGYRFTSVEIKELARRIDGVFIPQRDDFERWIYFAEIQFQPDDRLYERLMTEAFLYLGQYRPAHLWCCVAIWARASLDGGVPLYYRRLQEIGLLQVVYPNNLPEEESLGVSLLRLVSIEERRVEEVLTVLKGQLVAIADASLKREIVELIEKVLVYKFPRLTPEELAAMFSQQELEQTRFYQELVRRGLEQGLEQGLERGRLEGKLEAIPNMVALGLTAEQIAGALGLELAVVQDAIAKFNRE